jgi:predicted small lipoprotein YifL
MRHQLSLHVFALHVFMLAGCGARSGLEIGDAASADDGSILADAGRDAFVPPPDSGHDAGSDAFVPPPDAWIDCASRPVMPGDLIMGTGAAVYYIATNGRRYVFPNEDTYYSWYPDFSGVCVIPDAELATIWIGGNVTIRPGTFLVKITTDPKVYAISPQGELHWIESETVALRLYGPAWAHQIQDVPDSFFVNYTIGASLSAPVHSDGQLVTYVGSSDIYLIEGGLRRLLAPGAFEANGFQRADPRDPTIPFVLETDIAYPDGAPVTGRIPLYAEPICVACP